MLLLLILLLFASIEAAPTKAPSRQPSKAPSYAPSRFTRQPTSAAPTYSPTYFPSLSPSALSVISTFAGNGTSSFKGDNGQATSATLDTPIGVNIDSSGNIYIADSGNNRIRKVTISTGIISTVAGKGTASPTTNGIQATSSGLNDPDFITFDKSNNIFISDTGNNIIRFVTVSTGVIKTIAGNTTAGYSGDNKVGTSAQLDTNEGIAFDSKNNYLYICDFGNNRIRKLSLTTSIITTVAGTGTSGNTGNGGAATSATLTSPKGIAIDSIGNVYFTTGNVVRKITVSTGIINSYAGLTSSNVFVDGAISLAAFNSPYGLAFDNADNLFIADASNGRIRKVTNASTVTTVAGAGFGVSSVEGRVATSVSLSFPSGVAVDTSGNIFFSERGTSKILKVSVDGTVGPTIQPTSMKPSRRPSGYPSVTPTLLPTPGVKRPTSSPSSFSYAVTTVAGVGYGDGGLINVAYNYPLFMAMDTSKNIYVTDHLNSLVWKLTRSNTSTVIAGNGVSSYTGDDGAATSASLYYPTGIAVDSTRNILYVGDYASNRVREINITSGIISLYAGSGDTNKFSGDGSAAKSANIKYPVGVALDKSGNLYICDSGFHRIRKVDRKTKLISTVAGSSTSGSFSGDNGAATSAKLNSPYGVAVDTSGRRSCPSYHIDLMHYSNLL